MKLHKYCSMIPPMSKTEFSKLRDSISRDGLLVPIVMLGDEILDGRHRYQACKELDIEPITEQYSGVNPFNYAVSLNATRRHLTQSQRAMLAASIATLKKGELGNGRKLEGQICPPTIKQASETLSISTSAIKTAKNIKENAPASIIKSIEAGTITLNAASKIIKNIEPELLEKATPLELDAMSKQLSESINTKISKIVSLAKQLRTEYDALMRYEYTDQVITALHDVHFELSLIAQMKRK